jgi:hypothetical protein
MGAQNEGLTRKLTAEEEAAAERIYAAVKEKVEEQVRGMARLMASKKPSELLGRTEFELRDMVLELGANVLQTAVNERAKKGGRKIS